MLTSIATIISLSYTLSFQLPFQSLPHKTKTPSVRCRLSSDTTNTDANPVTVTGGGAAVLKSILQKPSKVLTIGLEFKADDNNRGDPLTPQEFSILSMQLRKSKISAVWCDDLESLQLFVKEQETARGDFPGPCPVVYHGPVEDSVAALEDYGASAVVVPADDSTDTQALVGCAGGEIIWKVSSAEQVQAVLERTGRRSDVFWLDGVSSIDDLESVVASLPKGALAIASVDAMQPDGAEVEKGKEYKQKGCGSIFVRRACVGDTEDLEYARFLVGGLTSKASSEFKFTGLTGSTNGHFGGVQASGSVKWRRVEEE